MVNNVGKTTKTLSTNLGTTETFDSTDSISLVAGEIGLGCMLFDEDGTIGIITTYTSETDFIVTTYAISIDIPSLLSLSY